MHNCCRKSISKAAIYSTIVAFVALMAFSTVHQVANVLENAEIYGTVTQYHDVITYPSTTIVVAAFNEMEMVRDRHHGAERQTKTKPRLLTNCSAFAIPYLGGQNKSEWRLLEDVQRAEGLWASYLFFEGPLKWANGYLYRLVCQNPGSHISYLTYVIPMEFQQFNAEWKEKYDDVDYIDGTGSKMGSYTLLVAQWGIIPTMVSSGSLTSVDMTRKETLLNGHLDHVEVVTQIATTMFREEALLGLTTISWRWVDGHILRVKNVRRDSYYSLAFILCTVLLAVERSYTFLLRARRGKQQEVQDSKDDH